MDRLLRIGEVSRRVAVKPFVLRYWETEFPMLRPVKSPRGQRRYRPEDVEVAMEIKRLLYDQGFTIAGARKHLKDNSAAAAGRGEPAARSRGPAAGSGDSPKRPYRARGIRALRQARDELRAILRLLEEDG